LTTIFAPHPTQPLLALFHPTIQPTIWRPRGHLDLDGWINFPAIYGQTLCQVGLAQIQV
jgi:hypothetical protein